MMKDYKSKILEISKKEENSTCIDCNVKYPKWVSIYYGTFMCLECAGVHRSLGIYLDSIKSVGLDVWNQNSYLSVKYGGNKKIRDYISKHKGVPTDIESKYRNETIIKYSIMLSELVYKKSGVEIKHADINSSSKSHKNKISYEDLSKVELVQPIKSIKSVLNPEWKNSIHGHVNEIKEKTILYGTKIGKSVYNHAKNLVVTSSEIFSKNFKDKSLEKTSKHTGNNSKSTKHNNKQDWS